MGRRIGRGRLILVTFAAVGLLAACTAVELKDFIIRVATSVFWEESAQLGAGATADAGDRFGYSVAVGGNTVVVGTYRDDMGVISNSGAVYFFDWDGKSWQRQTYTGSTANQWLGYSVAISGSYAVVGAPGVASAVDGKAYLFSKSGGTWSLEKELVRVGSPSTSQDLFGTSVDISGDYVVVGAPMTFNDSQRGLAYVFYRHQSGTDTWAQQAQLYASDWAGTDHYGRAASIADPYLVVGAPGNEQAYLFRRSGSSWGQY